MLKAWLAHPLTKGLDIDDPRTTHLRLQIIQEKSFLRQDLPGMVPIACAGLASR
jgi:hypothetical protein